MLSLPQDGCSCIKLMMSAKNTAVGSKFQNKLTVKSGSIINIRITAANNSSKSIRHTLIKCGLPLPLIFRRIIHGTSGNYFHSMISNSIIWDIPVISAQSSIKLDFDVIVMPRILTYEAFKVQSKLLEYQLEDHIDADFGDCLLSDLTIILASKN